MKNLRGFEVKYLGATNNLGSRIKIKDLYHNKTWTIPYDYTGKSYEQAANWLINKDIEIDFITESKDKYILLSRNFEEVK